MKKFLLSIFAVMLAVFSVQAEEYSYTLVKGDGTKFGDVTWNEVEWKISADNTSYCAWDGSTSKGYQFGSSKQSCKTLTLSTSGIKGTITKIVVNTSGASSIDASLTVSVGGIQYGNSTKLTSTSTDYTFENTTSSASGEIKLSYVNSSSKAIYIKSIAVTYESAGSGEGGGENPEPEEPETPVVTPPAVPTLTPSCSFDDAMTVYITNVAEGATAFYLLNNDTDWVEGESVKITETTTVYAKVVKDELSSEVVSAIYTKNIPLDPNAKEVEATISFASAAQRLSQDGNSQVWANAGVTFTNNKSASQNAVVNNTNPVRLYAGSELVIECAGNITKIVFDCNTSAYATTLKNSIGDAATASSDKVTVTLDGTSNNFTVAKLTAQVRMDALTVTYLVSASQEEKPAAPTFSVETGSKFYPTLEFEISAAEGAVIYYTLNGENPTTESDVYSTPITIEETTVVRAIAVVNGVESDVAAVSYKKVIDSVNGNVADAFNYYVGGEQIPAVVTGYIVGAVKGTSFGDGGENCKFDVTEIDNDANILIADNADETDYTKCLVVQLPSGSIRGGLNLVNNPGNLKKKVVLTATLETYFGVAGLKSTSAYEFVEEEEPVAETWSSFYAAMDTQIPAGVEAYIVTTANKEYVTLTQIFGTIPAMTGVIFKSNPKSNTGSEELANVEGNLLQGTMANTYINEEAYVLGCVDGEYGFYKADMNQQDGTAWLANAGKAYLPVSALPASAQGAASFSFRFDEGTTGIDEMTEQRAESKEIYDLTGRRVEAISAPGIYIVGGKKVLVK